ncbi:ABC transporter permease [Amycolatopsis jejuensis]|uniref:ABC transporter permease n=1 Tax=Amycolatopsis jejuensis TaxID=330084 RepID=UPI00069041F6|nr:ABC transporter permease [Amycolatopsis jejuensis]
MSAPRVLAAPARFRFGALPHRWLLVVPLLVLGLGIVLPLATLATRAMASTGAWATLTDPLFIQAVTRTLLLAVSVAVICLVLGTVFALALVSAPRKAKVGLWGVLLSTFWISLLVRTYGWVLLLEPNGALDKFLIGLGLRDSSLNALQTTPAMYPGMVHIMLPYMVLPIYASLAALEPSQLRAAKSMGAGTWLTLRKVILPQARPGAIAGAIIVFVLSLGFFVTPAFLGGPNKLTVGTIIEREFNDLFDFGGASAMSLALVVVVLVIYFVADKLFHVGEHWTAS